MSTTRSGATRTLLRQSFERIRQLDVTAQIRECVDIIENPSVLVDELLDAYRAVDSCGSLEDFEATPGDVDQELVLGFFYPECEVVVLGDEPSSFTCLATEVDPLAFPDDSCGGLDYIGAVRERECVFALGAVQSEFEPSPFLLLLRLLACACEVAPPEQLQRLDRELLKGALGESPRFDLHLVLWNLPDEGELATLGALTRDLAEAVVRAIEAEGSLPLPLERISCLQMDPDDFNGQLDRLWEL